MPRRNKKAVKITRRDDDSSSEGSISSDNASRFSFLNSEVSVSLNEIDAGESSDRFEGNFLTALHNITEKSGTLRCTGYKLMNDVLLHRYIPDYVNSRRETLTDCLEASIRRPKSEEQIWAARVAPLVALQVGGDGTIFKTMKQSFLFAIQNQNLACRARAKCCRALGLLIFLGSEDIDDLLKFMQDFEGIFSGSYLRGDDKTPTSINAETGSLHAEALSAWSLLLTLLSASDFVSLMNDDERSVFPSIKKLMGLLQSPHLDLRMAAGKALALIVECGRSHDELFMEDELGDLIEDVRQLATDSAKYRAKRDRKVQRSSFRDVLRYLEKDFSPEVNIRFGNENLVLDSWAMHHQYTSLCAVVGHGMTSQLQNNEFLRDIFDLGPKMSIPDNGNPNAKQAKLERHLTNAAAFKARTISRGKNRDKRASLKCDE